MPGTNQPPQQPQGTNPQALKIFQKEYEIPALRQRLEPIQQIIHAEVEIIQSGRVPEHVVEETIQEPGFLGLFSSRRVVRKTVPEAQLDLGARLERLTTLITHYNSLLGELQVNRDRYLKTLRDIEVDAGHEVRCALERQQEMARELLALREKLRERDKGELLEVNRSHRERLREAVCTTVQTGLLIWNKLEACRRGILALTDDEQAQVRLLHGLREDLELVRELHHAEKKLEVIEQEVRALAQVAVNLDGYLERCLGPLHQLLQEVGQVDERVATTLHQIEDLTTGLKEGTAAQYPLEESYQPILNLLVYRELRQTQIEELVEQVRKVEPEQVQVEMEVLTSAPLESSIQNAALFFERTYAQQEGEVRRGGA